VQRMATGKWYRAVYFKNLTGGTESKAPPTGSEPLQMQNASGGAGGVLMRLGNERANVTAWPREAEKRPALALRAWPE